MRIILLFIFLKSFYAFSEDKFQQYRKNLALAPNNKEVCFRMIKELGNKPSDAKTLGYLGAFTMIKANHQINPIQKLSSFNSGKKLLEKAIQQNSTDVELRYIRYAIQISIPKFLGYNGELAIDKKIMQNYLATSETALQADIKELLKVK